MKRNVLICGAALLASALFPVVAMGQCSYRASTDGGTFGSPMTYETPGGTCPDAPLTNSAAQVILDRNLTVYMPGNYVVGNGGNIAVSDFGHLVVTGHLTVESGGSITIGQNGTVEVMPGGSLDISSQGNVVLQQGGVLMGNYDLRIGDGTNAQKVTNLEIHDDSRVVAGRATVNKATIYVAPSASFTTGCNLVLYNSNIVDDGLVTIQGNLDLSPGGSNNVLCGNGTVSVAGCVFGGNGAVNHIAQNCAGKIAVCAQRAATSCGTGPVAGTNANEQACDELVPSCPKPLPVELVSFTAEPTTRQGVALEWVTASEKNSQSFVVERSADGRSFRANRTVAGAGTTAARTAYHVVDEQPLPGTSYYRLRQIDFNAAASYSPVRVVKLGPSTGPGLEVYPGKNAQEWVVASRLLAELLDAHGATVQVYDALGRAQAIGCTPAAETGRWTLDLHALPSGVYVVRLLTGSGSYSRRIVQ
ncbi:T9SS type A sorting domain-containing protein [Hymenobacter armeniacus]|uniref:T9SS type A sorting domain-containing protein n=1 Tax=Hymenobacter armeniacus TaxID=2771358 RepID=A0ABR8JRS9_9BACT|nr:T9SS type A sorting domain-containing protein [Hymenobacter armeniacus]MBD2722022.1 T9SS type A sorting domain-containing protein [Hymenobacter armeniacus]